MAAQNAADLISLPKGGGAQSGIGETFQPDLHTGTANLTVPLRTPPGRAEVAPQLALGYSSGNPNGPFGLGWALGVPGVRRRTSRGVPRYDGSDVFVLSGAEDLVPVSTASGVTRYRPRVESGYARIDHIADNRGDYWEVRTREGMRTRYGTPRPAGADASWRDPAVIKAPAGVFGWLVSETADSFGNRMVYEYAADPHGTAQRYLSRIRYVDVADEDRFLVGVGFAYADRPDAFSDRRGGFELRTTQRAVAMTTWTEAVAGQPVTGFQVSFRYADEFGEPPAGNVSLLARIEMSGVDGEQRQAMPPMTFGYTGWNPQKRRLIRLDGPLPTAALGANLDLVDLFGDGLPSVVSLDGSARYWRNTGDGHFAAPRDLAAAPAGVALGRPGVLFADLDGDGRPELVEATSARTTVWPLAAPGAPAGFAAPLRAQVSALPVADPRTRLADLDGDGRMGLLHCEDRWYAADGDGRGGFMGLRALLSAPPVPLTDPRCRMADMTGDGLSDVVLVHDGHIMYWPSLGRGRFDTPVTMHNAPKFGEAGAYGATGFDPRRLLLGDLTGDGTADVVYAGDGRVTIWLNQAGNGFANPITVTGTPQVTDRTDIRLADVLGAGQSGLLFTAEAMQGSAYRFLDLTGAVKPHLLSDVDNHRGARTSLAYATSTRYALADRAAGRPWRTSLPIPVHVVASVTVTDVIAGTTLTSEYSYHHGYWDGAEREFRGFARVEQRDTRSGVSTGSPPLLIRSWFHPGPVGPAEGNWTTPDFVDEFWSGDAPLTAAVDAGALPAGLPRRARRDAERAARGLLLRRETYALDGSSLQNRPYEVADTAYRLIVVDDGVFAAHPGLTRTAVWKRGTEPMVQVSVSTAPDSYGRVGAEAEFAVPRGRDPRIGTGSPLLGTVTVTEYATRDDDTAYLVSRATSRRRVEISDPGLPLLNLAAQVLSAPAGAVRSLELTFYDGDAFTGLPYGQIGVHGVPSRTEKLLITEQTAADVTVPVYLNPDGVTEWPGEYPAAFIASMAPLAGYLYRPDGDPYAAGYYAQAGFSYEPRHGLLTVQRDALGGETTVTYDGYAFLPARVVDPAGLARDAEHDYRTLSPAQVTDANGVRTRIGYTPLGQPGWIAILGRDGVREGDTAEQPGTVYEYDLTAWDTARRPMGVRTRRRIDHRWDLVARADADRAAHGQPPLTDDEIAKLFPGDETAAFPERFTEIAEYSDGFGRLVQARTQSDVDVLADLGLDPGAGGATRPAVSTVDADRVIVTGARAYDDKGRVVQAWEPYFATGLDYAAPGSGVLGALASATTAYDAGGVAVAVTNADGSVELHVPGIPDDLADPFTYRPTPWETYRYDGDDNAGRTHPDDSEAWSHQWNTPSSTTVDAFGRAVIQTEHYAPGQTRVTTTVRDIDGTVVEVIDPLGRTAAHTVVDLAARAWLTVTIDGGATHSVYDPMGNLIESRDGRGAITLSSYDTGHRPSRRWTSSATGTPAALSGLIVYGEAADSTVYAAGRAMRTYDEAGLIVAEAYDLSGNLLSRSRRVLRTDVLLAALPDGDGAWTDTAYAVDWEPAVGQSVADREAELLDTTEYALSSTFDALGRCLTTTTPVQSDGARTTLAYGYTRGGALTSIAADGVPHLTKVFYNARGQRTLAVLGNGLITRYAYDAANFRLLRLRTEPGTQSTPGTWTGVTGQSKVVQDYGYTYDLCGNLLLLSDRAPGSGMPIAAGQPGGLDALDRVFGYDSLYRLTFATGRQTATGPADEPWRDTPAPTDPTAAVAYQETYGYDLVGNLLSLAHKATSSYSRSCQPESATNRLATLTSGKTTSAYAYDAAGHLLTENSVRRFEWDAAGRCATFRVQTGEAEPSIYAQYRYDTGGVRVLKVVRRGGRTDMTVYIDGIYERLIRGAQAPASATVHEQLHLVDGANRVALLRRGAPLPGDPFPGTMYHLGDHLASSTAVADGAGAVLNREEFTPYGETCFGGYATKRYRFTAKERDEESGLAYHGARYLAPWLGRWTAPDPQFPTGNLSWYRYANSNPLTVIDPTGAADAKADSTMPKDAAQMSASSAGQAFRKNPFSLEGFKALLQGLKLYGGTPQRSDGTPLSSTEQRDMFIRNTELGYCYARGFGYWTCHAMIGESVPEGSVQSEKLTNALALAGPLLKGIAEYRAFAQSTAEFRAWNAAHSGYQEMFLENLTDAAGRPVTAAEAAGLMSTIERMAWNNWKLSVPFKYSGNRGLDLHFLGVAENSGLRAIGEAKGATGLGALATPTTTEIVGGFRQGSEMYIGMSLQSYVEAGGAHADEANKVMSMLRSGNVKSFCGAADGRLWELNFWGNVDFNRTRKAAKLIEAF